jgi:GTP-binding protein HflX
VIVAYNKIDKLGEGAGAPGEGVAVSAVTGQGVDGLLRAVEGLLKSEWESLRVTVPAGDGKLLAWLYAHGEVVDSKLDGEEWTLNVRLREADARVWEKMG